MSDDPKPFLQPALRRAMQDMAEQLAQEARRMMPTRTGSYSLKCLVCGKLNHVGIQHACRPTAPIRVQAHVGRPVAEIEDAEVIEDEG